MISKAKLKQFAAFKAQKQCDGAGLFVVEGVKMVEEALRCDVDIEVLCATEEWMEGKLENELPMEHYVVNQEELERLSSLKSPNQVWALCRRGEMKSVKATMGITLALDHLQDPGNLGTIIRSADWFGIRNIVCSKDTVSCYNPKVVQSTMGGLFRMKIEYVDLVEWLKECNKPICGALLEGKDVYREELPMDGVLVIGNESRGISEAVKGLINCPLTIPNIGETCESLNAGVAASILMSEFARRK